MDKFRKISHIINKIIDINSIIEEFVQNDNNVALLQEEVLQLKRKILILKLRQIKLIAVLKSITSQKRIWSRMKSQLYWDIDCQLNGEEFFKNNFRMSRKSFAILCESLTALRKRDTNFRKAISLEKRVAIALYALGSSTEYRNIANLFGVSRPLVCSILFEFCREAWKYLMPLYLKNFPLTREAIEKYVKNFEKLGLPQCLGAIDTCHFPIHPKLKEAGDYYNSSGWYSIVLLALVDARCCFIDINIGDFGRQSNFHIYMNSLLKHQLKECTLFKEMTKTISNASVPIFVIGDSTFPSSDILINPYPFHILQNDNEKLFNSTFSKSRKVTEDAFERLKARFQRIGTNIDNQMGNASLIVKTCCALHNFLTEQNDELNKEWLNAQQLIDFKRKQPLSTEATGNITNETKKIKEVLSVFIASRGAGDAERLTAKDENEEFEYDEAMDSGMLRGCDEVTDIDDERSDSVISTADVS